VSWRKTASALILNRRRIVAILVVVVVYFGGIGGAYFLAARSAASVVELCQAGNVARQQQITLWDHFAAISKAPPHETPAQKAVRLREVASILTYIHHVFAPRNCSQPSKALR